MTGSTADPEPLTRVERHDAVGVVLLNRPRQLNALSDDLMRAIVADLAAFDADPAIRCIVLGGSERAFAAGADISQMSKTTSMEFAFSGRVEQWDAIRRVATPLVAAVSGFCLGGGCELAMACDLVVASESAVFGQPETGVGIIPGAGGTQRLTRAIGKAKTMDMVLTGRTLDAREAERAGLVARVVAREAWLSEAIRVGREIARRAPIAQRLAVEAVDRAAETTLDSGLDFERKALYLAFASEDAREGLSAFVDKREPRWQSK
jgi:enoyl-CoA hydratase